MLKLIYLILYVTETISKYSCKNLWFLKHVYKWSVQFIDTLSVEFTLRDCKNYCLSWFMLLKTVPFIPPRTYPPPFSHLLCVFNDEAWGWLRLLLLSCLPNFSPFEPLLFTADHRHDKRHRPGFITVHPSPWSYFQSPPTVQLNRFDPKSELQITLKGGKRGGSTHPVPYSYALLASSCERMPFQHPPPFLVQNSFSSLPIVAPPTSLIHLQYPFFCKVRSSLVPFRVRFYFYLFHRSIF